MNSVQTLVGWYFLPSAIASASQKAYYRITRRFAPPPAQGSPQHEFHRKVSFCLVVVFYLFYTLYTSYQEIIDDPDTGPDYYTQLGVSSSASRNEIRKIFRQLSVLHHPDKVGPGGEQRWMELKTLYDVLSNAVYRFGYNRFGTQIAQWAGMLGGDESDRVTTVTEVMYKGLIGIAKYYGSALFGVTVLPLLRLTSPERYWRYFILLAGLATELFIVTRSDSDLRNLLPAWLNLLPYQEIMLIRRLVLSIQIGMNQLQRISFVSEPNGEEAVDDIETQVETISRLASGVLQESTIATDLIMEPIRKHPEYKTKMQDECGNCVVQSKVVMEGSVRDAIQNVKKNE